ncbi:hypothetical protein IZ6_08820 [Terrihabitans soli]|uniref:UrcA family protein n=1 Tax=Terrihabitans soli TaxID=708113 RepID=A0A6S6QQA3_9HYPH|nr:hypothetical protein [Terrihabitans soli]BCJ90147.1 hypothetical protein IZ6_08820 [Terrihabitans soli]
MLKLAAALLLLLVAGGEVHAQAFGSVHCKAALRQIETDLQATGRKLQSTENGATAEKCSAMNVHVLTLEHAAEVYGRCIAGQERDEKLGRTNVSAADLRDLIAKTCG